MNRRSASFLVLSSICIALLAASVPLRVWASQDLSMTPAVIDEKGKPRDILKEVILLTNTSDHVISVFPTVKDVNVSDGQQSFDRANNADELSDSLANWIELSRGVLTIGPGEQREVPFVIRLNPNAVPNTYHAEISFASGETRDKAEASTPLATVAVNLEVLADVKEIMQLNTFTADGVVFTGDDVLFNYQLQNIGNQELEPKGEIRIYDRKGQEVAAIDVNKEGKIVEPDQVAQLASVWSAANGFGKFKALLDVSYGKGQTATVQDTVFFWIVPWKQLFALLIVSLLAIIGLALYFHRWLEERHLGKLAHAGLLKVDALVESVHHTRPAAATKPKSRKGFSIFGGHAEPPKDIGIRGTPPVVSTAPAASTIQRLADHTIDLKQMWEAQREAQMPQSVSTDASEQQGPVINLKKRQ